MSLKPLMLSYHVRFAGIDPMSNSFPRRDDILFIHNQFRPCDSVKASIDALGLNIVSIRVQPTNDFDPDLVSIFLSIW